MDSTGLRFVLAADARATGSDRRFVVLRGPRNVQRVFHLALLEIAWIRGFGRRDRGRDG